MELMRNATGSEMKFYKNDSIQSKKFLVLKLPRFFPRRIGDEKEWQFQNQNFSTEWSRSYIALALRYANTNRDVLQSNKLEPLCNSMKDYESIFTELGKCLMNISEISILDHSGTSTTYSSIIVKLFKNPLPCFCKRLSRLPDALDTMH